MNTLERNIIKAAIRWFHQNGTAVYDPDATTELDGAIGHYLASRIAFLKEQVKMSDTNLPEFKSAKEVEQYFRRWRDGILRKHALQRADLERDHAKDLAKWYAHKLVALVPFGGKAEEDITLLD